MCRERERERDVQMVSECDDAYFNFAQANPCHLLPSHENCSTRKLCMKIKSILILCEQNRLPQQQQQQPQKMHYVKNKKLKNAHNNSLQPVSFDFVSFLSTILCYGSLSNNINKNNNSNKSVHTMLEYFGLRFKAHIF